MKPKGTKFTFEKPTRKSDFTVSGKHLHEMCGDELLDAVEHIWKDRNAKMDAAKAEAEVYKKLLASPLPVHSLWRGFLENAFFIVSVAWIIAAIARAVTS